MVSRQALKFMAITVGLTALAAASCSGKHEFYGTTKSVESHPTPAPKSGNAAAKAPDNSCKPGQSVEVKWSGPAQDCIENQRGTFNFGLGLCAKMRKSPFSCDWATVVPLLRDKGLLSSTLQKASTDGSKLVSCSQSQDESRVVVQWISADALSQDVCSYNSANVKINTGCYMEYASDQIPPAPKTDAERDKIVYDCMNNL